MTDTPYRRKLVETALPLEAINVACRADKTRNVGTIRNIHKWFAPMPLPALRALIFASLIDDPGDEEERAHLLTLVEGLVGQGADDALKLAQRIIKERFEPLPVVLDPFCGGGSTLVEAQRLGLPSEGSDLNPIPVLISKSLTEFPHTNWDHDPLHQDPNALATSGWQGLTGFVSDVRYYAGLVRSRAMTSIGHHYPTGPDGHLVFAWWWARTVPSPDPRFQGCLTPLVTSWWLTKQHGAEQWLEASVSERRIEFEVRSTGEPPEPSKSRCIYSNAPISFEYVRDQGQRGLLGSEMMAFVTLGDRTRSNWAATAEQRSAAESATPSSIASARLPEAALGFRVQGYGMKHWHDLFLPRQRLALETFASEIAAVTSQILSDGGSAEYARSIVTILGLSLGKMAQLHSTLVGWGPRNGPTRALTAFSQQVVSMTWDFCELNPFSGAQGDWLQTVETALGSLSAVNPEGPSASVEQKDARSVRPAKDAPVLIVTDPPYFEAIGYADLSDYFYPWLRLALRDAYPDLFATISAPKSGELIANPYIHDSEAEAKTYFIDGFREVFARIADGRDQALPMLIVYAHKETEVEDGGDVSSGWEAMLEAVTQAGLAVVATWPIHGAAAGRVRSRGSNALATYVVLVCRPRLSSAARVSRREFGSKLRSDLAPAVRLLQSAAVAPVDMAQAVIGPGMAVFTGYESVLEADGTRMGVRSALLLINTVLAEVLDEQEGEFDSDTRWAITWFEQFQFGEAPSGEADSLARAKVTSIDGLERAGVIRTRAGTCRLLRRDELPDAYDPREDIRATVWESVQHLVKRLLTAGEEEAASLLARLPNGETSRDLAYRLYAICERKGWAEEGGAYNVLVTSWPEIARLAQHQQTQQRLGSGQFPGLGLELDADA